MFVRGGIGLLVNIIMINRDLKKVVWDTIGREHRFNLWAKVFQNLISVFLQFSAIKYFPLTYVNATRNLAPFFALIFSACCLSEPPTSKQVIVLTFIVALSIGFVFTGDPESN